VNFFFSRRSLIQIATAASSLLLVSSVLLVGAFEYYSGKNFPQENIFAVLGASNLSTQAKESLNADAIARTIQTLNGRPHLSPLPDPQEVWQCEVIVVGGSLGGVAAASHAMRTGATTCLIELTPWLGGQISSQGVSAVDESLAMRWLQNFSQSWKDFKWLIRQQPTQLPSWSGIPAGTPVDDLNSCWVGRLCFPPKAGAIAAEQWLRASSHAAPQSRWGTAIAFKGASFDLTGQNITGIYAVRRIPRDPNYQPQGLLSEELSSWYGWSGDDTFDKVPIRLEAPPGKKLIVIDATDTGELVAWAKIPYRVGSESQQLTGEINAPAQSNPDCTQAFTFPFVLAIHDDQGQSRAALDTVYSDYPKREHLRVFSMDGFPMFRGGSLFNYRRIVSKTLSDPLYGTPVRGDMTMVNWTRGNDWNWMNPPLILSDEKLTSTGQYQNWMGGLSWSALRHAETHALLFAQWLIDHQSQPEFPLTYVMGKDSPMGTASGLSLYPYIREGRRILGRSGYGDQAFLMREADLRKDMSGGRNFSPSAIAITHYAIDIHGCRYRNWEPAWEAQRAGSIESKVHPAIIPLESLIPQGVDNLLIGSKAIAVTHIVNSLTRVHYGEWSIGGAAGATAGWLITKAPDVIPADIVPKGLMPQLQQHLRQQGLRFKW
jgi:FAD dependent oxidoreductase